MIEREFIDAGNDKRDVRRDKEGGFKESVDVSSALPTDARHDAKHDAQSRQGDEGDHKHSPSR